MMKILMNNMIPQQNSSQIVGCLHASHQQYVTPDAVSKSICKFDIAFSSGITLIEVFVKQLVNKSNK